MTAVSPSLLNLQSVYMPFCMSPQGQTWIQNVRRCLINAISIQYQSGANCEQLEESAFNSHPDCYVSNGFCTDILFSVTNLRGLYNVLSTKIEVLFTKRSLKQVCAHT